MLICQLHCLDNLESLGATSLECMHLLKDMSTLIKSGAFWFSDYHSRWLTSMESLTCQGFPVHAEWSYMVPCCSYAARHAGLSSTDPPSRGAAIGQSGNSMHTEVAAVILSYALLEIELDRCAKTLFMGAFQSRVLAPVQRPTGTFHDEEEADEKQTDNRNISNDSKST